jgi:hypothetical protein
MIVSRLIGGLGNQMFQYALAKKLAIKNNTEVYFDLHLLLDHTSTKKKQVNRNFDLDIFNFSKRFISKDESNKFNGLKTNSVTLKILIKLKKIIFPLKIIIEKNRGFDKQILNTKNNYCIVGSFQSPRYFDDIRNDILRDFIIKEEFIEKSNQSEKIIKNKITVSVHFRRGDYLTNNYYKDIFGELPMSYYKEAYKIFNTKFPNASYFIFSDDIKWVKNNISIFKNATFIENSSSKKGMATDLFQMTICDHHIISNSTFAWWGAWLNNKDNKFVVAPKMWVSKKYFGDKSIHPTDIIPENWKTI